MRLRGTTHRSLLWLLLAGVLLPGCWWTTTSVAPAAAGPGETGYGVEAHKYTIFAVLAYAETTVISTGITASVPAAPGPTTESVWQSFDGGRQLRHCVHGTDGSQACRTATMAGEDGWSPEFMTIIDPINLGRGIVATTWSGTDGAEYTYASGSVAIHGMTTVSTPSDGIWVQGPSLWHCQLESSVPVCRTLPMDSGGFFGGLGSAVGMFVLDGPDGAPVDVLWVSTTDGNLSRCTASAAQPEVQCVTATVQTGAAATR